MVVRAAAAQRDADGDDGDDDHQAEQEEDEHEELDEDVVRRNGEEQRRVKDDDEMRSAMRLCKSPQAAAAQRDVNGYADHQVEQEEDGHEELDEDVVRRDGRMVRRVEPHRRAHL